MCRNYNSSKPCSFMCGSYKERMGENYIKCLSAMPMSRKLDNKQWPIITAEMEELVAL